MTQKIKCALIGADVITAPPSIIKALANHPLTDAGLAQFEKDWAKTSRTVDFRFQSPLQSKA